MSKRLIVILLLIIIGFLGLFVLASKGDDQSEQALLRPVESFQHAHGLAVDVGNSDQVYIATHNGLFMLQNDTELYQVGSKTDDFMGFSLHPTDPNTIYTSGHPKTGGNIGFQSTTDGGRIWERVSNGTNGPVDFHALAVSHANPETIYGWYAGNLQRSTNAGKEWRILDTGLEGVISLATHPTEAATVYAATTNGIQKSENQGGTWSSTASDLEGTAVTVLAINPINASEWISFSEKLGLAKSSDAGQTWERLDVGRSQETILHVAYDPKNPATVYALSQNDALFKTTDGGASWQQVR
jgi:hypothetical protein